jgi:membrane protease YdiL (CAAX protease family)
MPRLLLACAALLAGTFAVLFCCLEVGGLLGRQLVALAPSAWLLAGTAFVWLLAQRRRFIEPLPPVHPRAWALFCGLSGALLLLFVGLGARGTLPKPEGILFAELAIVCLVPIAEELYFRGLLRETLEAMTGRLGALVLSSALFALVHGPQGLFWLMLGLGLALGAVAIASRSILPAIAVHVVWNTLTVLRDHEPTLRAAAILCLAEVVLLGTCLVGLREARRLGARP